LSSDLVLCTAEAVPPSDIFCRIDELAPCLNFTQKDLAVALGVSAARVSQLIKIGMPLHSISAAKEWRIQQQRAVEETPELIESLVHKLPDVEQNDAHVLAAETESLASFVSQDQSEPLTKLDSRATSHSMDSLVELVASKKPITREYLESLTTLHLRALCQPRGLRVRVS
jgi:transcriptional regulator with XRE-family HTH domain